jgi:hypothetical protein
MLAAAFCELLIYMFNSLNTRTALVKNQPTPRAGASGANALYRKSTPH